MRHVTRVACLGLGLLLLAPAASYAGSGIWGFYGGLNIANMGGDMEKFADELADELENTVGGTWSTRKTSRTGLALGASYAFVLSRTVGLQVEASYVSRGTSLDFDESQGVEFHSSFELDYLEIPLLLRLDVSPEADVSLVLLLGPVVGFRVGADYALESGSNDASLDAGEAFTGTSFGMEFGMGARISAGETTSFLLQARYFQGLTNILDSDVYSSKPGDFMLLAGMEFGPK